MKIKLKKNVQLPSARCHQGLDYKDWLALNNGKEIEVDSIPDLIKNQVNEIKKKGDE